MPPTLNWQYNSHPRFSPNRLRGSVGNRWTPHIFIRRDQTNKGGIRQTLQKLHGMQEVLVSPTIITIIWHVSNFRKQIKSTKGHTSRHPHLFCNISWPSLRLCPHLVREGHILLLKLLKLWLQKEKKKTSQQTVLINSSPMQNRRERLASFWHFKLCN